LGTLALWVLELFATYMTGVQTDVRTDKSKAYCSPFLRSEGGHNNYKIKIRNYLRQEKMATPIHLLHKQVLDSDTLTATDDKNVCGSFQNL